MEKVILAIMDGVGYRKGKYGNALALANTPNLDKICRDYPSSLLQASGIYVGLPKGQMGNSEVGHLTIGAGRIEDQSLEKVNKAIRNGTFYSNETIVNAFQSVIENKKKLHICGLISDGGVHSHINHIITLIKMANDYGIKEIYIHAFLDGRDTKPKAAMKYLKILEKAIKGTNAKIATIAGRYYAMDRELMWNKTKMAYDAMVYARGNYANNYRELLLNSYKNKIDDEFVVPTIINKNGVIKSGDTIIMANIRSDRITQLFSAITNPLFDKFKIKKLNSIKLFTMFPVDKQVVCENIFKQDEIKNTLGQVLSDNNKKVLRISEVSKYPHVTHFFDGDRDINYKGTKKVKINRVNVDTYDLAPKMSASKITDYVIDNIDNYDVIILNYPNGDMVGHTGNLCAAIEGIEEIDRNIGRLFHEAKAKKMCLIITADHGNCEQMLDRKGNILKTHTTNKVPFIVCDKHYETFNGKLSDIAPTILRILDIPIPIEMTGNVIIEKR